MDLTILREIWLRACSCHGEGLAAYLCELLDGYVRRPGKDELVRITPECIGQGAYLKLLAVLSAQSRRHVWYHDHGWHIELRSRLWGYLIRRLQRELVLSGCATEMITDDLLAHDVGI